MRFGQDYHEVMIPEWEEHYVDYNRLKQLLKSRQTGEDGSDSAASLLSNAIRNQTGFIDSSVSAKTFASSRSQHFKNEHEDYHDYLDYLDYAEKKDIGFQELTILLDACVHERHYLQKLQRFHKVNEAALDRICEKPSSEASSSTIWSQERPNIRHQLLSAEKKLTRTEDTFRNALKARTVKNPMIDLTRLPLACLIISAGLAKNSGGQQYAKWALSDRFHEKPNALRAQLLKQWHDKWPLVYAAHYGLCEDCCLIVIALFNHPRQAPDEGSNGRNTVSTMVLDSLREAASEARTQTALLLLNVTKRFRCDDNEEMVAKSLGGTLRIAIRNQNDELVGGLLAFKPDLSLSINGQTILHVAAQIGRIDYTFMLLHAFRQQHLAFDTGDASRGWTPLFFAASEGHYDVAKLLLEAGSSQTGLDLQGWTAQEHAAFRGHLAVADLLTGRAVGQNNPGSGPATQSLGLTPNAAITCQPGEKVIIVNLGSSQKNKNGPAAVDLSYCPTTQSPVSYGHQDLCLEMSVPAAPTTVQRISLPILNDTINNPCVFTIPDSAKSHLLLKVLSTRKDGGQTDMTVLGTGITLLGSNADQFGTNRQSLVREQTISIIHQESLDIAGTITLTYIIARPFRHLEQPVPAHRLDLIRTSESPLLVGHRGMGMNFPTRSHLQIGENTVESFLTASRLGADFVEFDVQITKDLQPVIYHDFSLSESGTDVPIHDVSLEQYLYASNIQSPHGNPLSTLGKVHAHSHSKARQRSRSVGNHFEQGSIQVHDQMKHTTDYKLKGFKPNTRGEIIQDTFATLKEILVRLPEHIGLDIEIKYPRLHEAQDAGVAPVAIELNTFVDVVLETIFKFFSPQRKIVLSSFTPEICILASLKQKIYPVFFITNAGKVPMTDMEVRAASVQAAVKFAKRWNLTGVVFACEALLLCPRLVGYVKNRGLICASYGTLNNEPDKVKSQVQAGVDIIIADRVGLIAKALRSRGSAVMN